MKKIMFSNKRKSGVLGSGCVCVNVRWLLKVMSMGLLVLVGSGVAWGQEHIGPSLTASAGKIAYEKGKLDAELIAEIVATKQDEIKKELMHRTILKNIACGPFATWNYVRQSMNILLGETDSKVITKNLLTYTTELAVVMAISEYYLDFLSKRSKGGKLNGNEEKFLEQYFSDMDEEAQTSFKRDFNLSMQELKRDDIIEKDKYSEVIDIYFYSRDDLKEAKKKLIKKSPKSKKDIKSKLKDKINDAPKESKYRNRRVYQLNFNEYLSEIKLLKEFKNRSRGEKKGSWNGNNFCGRVSPNYILIDLVYDICMKNKYLQRYGFFHDIGIDNDTYTYTNKFLSISDNTVRAHYGKVRNEIDSLINLVFGSSEAIELVYSEIEEEDKKIDASLIKKVIEKRELTGASAYDKMVSAIQKMKVGTLDGEVEEDWADMLNNIIKLTTIRLNDENANDLLYFIRQEVKPQLLELNMASSSNIDKVISSVNGYEKVVQHRALNALKKDFKSFTDAIQHAKEIDFKHFIRLVRIIDNLDDPLTYDITGKFIAGMGSIFSDNRAVNILNRFVNDFDKYLILDREKQELSLSVEDIAEDLFDRFGVNNSSKFSFYFSVGVNYGWAPREFRIQNINEVTTEDGQTRLDTTVTKIRSINFVSEKIGVKFKLMDNSQNIAYGLRKPKERSGDYKKGASRDTWKNKAILRDVHVLVYGSGLLYRIKALNSESDALSGPVFGAGVGASFFNGLDANLSYAWPVNKKFSHAFINAGFDIKIGEYLQALRRKRKKSS